MHKNYNFSIPAVFHIMTFGYSCTFTYILYIKGSTNRLNFMLF